MDVTGLRRLVMAQMAQGADYEKGTFTTGTGSTYTLSFEKTFSKYLYFIEMTDASKTTLMNSGQSSAKMFSCYGIYPAIEFDNSHSATSNYMAWRINPSDSSISNSANTVPQGINGSSITFGNAAFTGGANSLYKELSYNYYVVEIK